MNTINVYISFRLWCLLSLSLALTQEPRRGWEDAREWCCEIANETKIHHKFNVGLIAAKCKHLMRQFGRVISVKLSNFHGHLTAFPANKISIYTSSNIDSMPLRESMNENARKLLSTIVSDIAFPFSRNFILFSLCFFFLSRIIFLLCDIFAVLDIARTCFYAALWPCSTTHSKKLFITVKI